jgi:hypothetical protein
MEMGRRRFFITTRFVWTKQRVEAVLPGLFGVPELHVFHLPIKMLHAWRPTCNKGISGTPKSPGSTVRLLHLLCFSGILCFGEYHLTVSLMSAVVRTFSSVKKSC